MRIVALVLIVIAACGDNLAPRADVIATHSSSIALSPGGDLLYVVDPDTDSVAVIDTATRSFVRTFVLGTPVLDATTGAFTPSVMPRAIAVSPDGEELYVTGQRGSRLFVISSITKYSYGVTTTGHCTEPVGVVADREGAYVYVACAQDDEILKIDTKSLEVVARASVDREPWALAWSSDGALLVSHLTSPEVTALDPAALAPLATWTLPDIALRDNDARLAHGQPRGLYDLAPRPGTNDVWIPHIMLGTDTPQPDLDFETTAFPSLALVRDDGTYRRTLSVDVADIPRVDGAFGDIVSGPHALAFTSDGAYALVVDQNSEDLLVVDAEAEVEAALVRPLPGHMPEGIVLAPDDSVAYIDERNTGDVAIVRIDRTGSAIALAVDKTIPFRTDDPMPPDQRLGQHLFYSANSDEYPITRNHWVACASCHIEGRSDAVTWLFSQGPRDTPTNAGGMLGTGFLFRTADRTQVQDYWKTVNVEQGGRFDPDAQRALLDPLAAYVNLAIPAPIPPATDPALVERGRALFQDPAVGCAACHSGPHFTDSAAGNAMLDLAGPVVLHDVGTCATADAPYPDIEHTDRDGHPRQACMFDTPSLVGVASSPPYFHDGRAPTLLDALDQTRGTMGHIEQLTPDDLHALVEYLRSL